MNPGTLVPDVRHLKKVLVKARLLQGGPEKGFMRPRRAGGNDNAVEAILRNLFLDLYLRVVGARIEIVLRIRHIRKALCVLHQIRHVHKTGNVRPAVAHKHPYPWVLTHYISLRWEFFLGDETTLCV